MPRDLTGRVATLIETKNGTKRKVPLSKRAMYLIELLPLERKTGRYSASPQNRSTRCFARPGREPVSMAPPSTTRHLAITRLAKKLGVLDLARMVGRCDLK
jgi:hypothetical protein